ncbi:MAG: carbon storage regulator CsrA [Verrucomicrobiae bacterium]|nr:carbon storage regulator CsrA [Verrucomicrobiae bacterium]
MLVLTRKINESVVIGGSITVRIVRIDGDQVRLGIEAPQDVPVHRQEVYDEIQRSNREAVHTVRPVLPRWKGAQPAPQTLTPHNVTPVTAPGAAHS